MTEEFNYKITETHIRDLPSQEPHKHVSALDLNRLGYDFSIPTTDSNLTLTSVAYCKEPMSIETFLIALWHLGINTDAKVYVEAVLHRPIHTNKPTYGYRFGGLERSDDLWVKSDYASFEAKMSASKMADMRQEVAKMSVPLAEASEQMFRKLNKKKKKKTP